jgi:hypothetical protein
MPARAVYRANLPTGIPMPHAPRSPSPRILSPSVTTMARTSGSGLVDEVQKYWLILQTYYVYIEYNCILVTNTTTVIPRKHTTVLVLAAVFWVVILCHLVRGY